MKLRALTVLMTLTALPLACDRDSDGDSDSTTGDMGSSTTTTTDGMDSSTTGTMGSSTTTTTDGMDSSTTTDGGVMVTCEPPQSESLVTCGAHQQTDEDPCGGGSGGVETGGGSTGTDTDSGGDCEQFEEANLDVVECIQQSAADGVAFTFTDSYYANGGQFDHQSFHHVASDGSVWRSRSGYDDLCLLDESAIYGPVDLSTCTDWDCVETVVQSAPFIQGCHDNGNCDGV
ncbi:MAG: hypothetical protein AAGF11_46215 [Myxococcota bacterium]